MKQDTNNYWEQLERMEKLIRASEFKAGVIFSYHSLILGFFADRLGSFEDVLGGNIVFLILLILWFISVFISIYYCFRCFQPHMELEYDDNVFFFKDAVEKFGSKKEYAKELVKVCSDEDEIVHKLAEQIHAESNIIDKKFYNVKMAIQYFKVSFGFLVIALCVWVYISTF